MTSRVREVAVRLRVPPALAARSDDLRRSVGDDLVVPVLEELERRFHHRYGAHAIIRVRELRMSWRIGIDELGETAAIVRLAADVADGLFAQLDARSGPERLRPRGGQVAAFEDAAHSVAAYLADVSDGHGDGWVHRGFESPAATYAEAIGKGSGSVVAVLGWLARMERLDAVLDAAPGDVIAALLAIVPADQRPAALVRAAERTQRGGPHARASRAPTSSSAAASSTAPSSTAPPAASPAEPDLVAAHARDAQVDAAAQPVAADELQPLGETTTAAAGLFYLVGRVLELDLAERLWATGIPERDVLAHVAAAILGDTDDPAWRWFGGVFDRAPASPAVPDWAVAEINELAMHALGARLARLGVDTTPALLDAALTRLADDFPPVVPVDSRLAQVVSRGAAAIVHVAAARLGQPPTIALARALCTRPGHLTLTEHALVVTIPSTCVDVDHRRAGLDHDPGRVPWLERNLRFRFSGGVEL